MYRYYIFKCAANFACLQIFVLAEIHRSRRLFCMAIISRSSYFNALHEYVAGEIFSRKAAYRDNFSNLCICTDVQNKINTCRLAWPNLRRTYTSGISGRCMMYKSSNLVWRSQTQVYLAFRARVRLRQATSNLFIIIIIISFCMTAFDIAIYVYMHSQM